MIRVLHVVNKMNRGGIETFIMNVYRNIDRNKIQFDFLMETDEECDYSEEIRSLGGKVFSIISRRKGILKNKKSLNHFFEKHTEYSVIHHHVSSLSYVEPLKMAKKYGVPVRIVHSHSTREGGSSIHKYIHQWNQLKVKSYATDYFACSDLAAKWLYGEKQYINREYTIIKNGVETKRFTFNEHTRKEKRKEFGIEDKFVVGHVGSFVYPKNHDFLIDVFKQIHDINSTAALLLVGDGEKKHFIEQKVADLQLSDSVIFTGIRKDIPQLLKAMDVLVFPSHYEGLPVTLVEAQAASLPCFISDKITDEIMITDLITKLSLNSEVKLWAQKILKYADDYERKNTLQDIVQSGYDISETVKVLESTYYKSM